MVPAKLLVGSVVAVGSVSTAAVVAHQQGFFSLPGSQTQSSDNAIPNADTAEEQDSAESTDRATTPEAVHNDTTPEQPKPNQKAIEGWLSSNKKEGENWKIQIKKSRETQEKEFKDPTITENDLQGLFGYLDSSTNKEILKSLFSAVESKTLTFENTTDGWKHALTKEEVDLWIKTNSKSNATLKLLIGGEEKTLSDVREKEDLQKLFDCLKNSNKFSSLETATTLIFEKVNDGWKHIQKSIEDWIKEKSGSSDTLKALKTKKESEDKQLSDWKDEELKKLLDYLKKYEKLFATWKKDSDTNKPSLEFKQEGDGWKLIASQKTIEIWVKATSDDNATLKLRENNAEKALSTITAQEDLKKILEFLEEESNKKLFSDLAGKTVKKTFVFEKDSTKWKHIKAAIKEWLESSEGGGGKLKVQIKKDSSSPLDWDNSTFEDEDLIGLLKHLQDKKSTYISTTDGIQTDSSVVLKKKEGSTSNEWDKFTAAA